MGFVFVVPNFCVTVAELVPKLQSHMQKGLKGLNDHSLPKN